MQLIKIISKYRIFLLVSLGIFIRMVLISLPGFKFDVNSWFGWSMRLTEVSYANFYSKDFFSDYTPGYMYTLSFLGAVKNTLNLNSDVFYLVLKIPAIIAEIAIGIFIYKILSKYSSFYALLGASLVILNPVLIFNSTIWGQVDSILSLLLLLTIYFLQNNKLILSAVFLGLSFLVKPQAIALFPLYLLYLLSHFSLKNLLKISLPFLFIVFMFSLPFFPDKPLTGLIRLILNTAREYPYTSLFAYNLWGVVGFWISDSQLWNGLTYQSWGYILLASYWIIIGYFFFKHKLSVYSLATLATLGFFFLPTRVHERYLYPAIIFLILISVMYKSRLLIFLTGLLSLLHFANLYYVYVYYNEIYFNSPKILYHPLIYNFLEINSKGLSIISLIIFVFISIIILKDYDTAKKT